MIKLDLCTPNVNPSTGELAWETVSSLTVEGEAVEIEGDSRWIDFTLPLVSLRTGEQIRFDDDHEEWARNLPTAFRSGDPVVAVVHDDNPITELAERDSDDRERVVLDEPVYRAGGMAV